MSTDYLSQDLSGRDIVSISNGQIIGKVAGVMIDSATLQVAALVTSKGSLLKWDRETEAIPSHEVQVWGQDVILVSRPDVMARKEELPGSDKWLSVSEQIKGHDVVGTDGTRIGQLNDVVIDSEGQFVGYDLARVSVKGPVATSKRIPTGATHALGGDVLIVDPSELVGPEGPAEEVPPEEPIEVIEPEEPAEPEDPLSDI